MLLPDIRSQLLDDARSLVAQDDRSGPLPFPITHVEVGMAHAGGEHPDPEFFRPRCVELEHLDLRWDARPV